MRIIAGEARGRNIQAPAGMNTRPTLDRVRENLFNMLQGDIAGSRVLDLFSGSGALSLEALSRGAESAFLGDCDRKATRCQLENIRKLGYEDRTEVVTADWRMTLKSLKKEGRLFDLVFLDPPYRMNDLQDIFHALTDVIEECTLIVVEHEADTPVLIPDSYEILKKRSWGYCGIMICRKREIGKKELKSL